MASNQAFHEVDFEEMSDESEISETSEDEDSEVSSNKYTENIIASLDIDQDEILFHAIENETPTIVKHLLKKVCNPNARYSTGTKIDVEDESKMMTPLLKAFEKNRTDIAKILLENGADISPALQYAASSGKLEIIEFLLKCNAYVGHINDEKCTPLHLAVKNNSWEVSDRLEAMKILLENGANVNAKNSALDTPLFCAINIGNIEMIKLLLEYDIDINAVDSDGDSALHIALNPLNVIDAEIVEALLQKGANVNVLDVAMRTPLYYAQPKIAKLFFEYASNLDLCVRDYVRNTVFEEALSNKDLNIMKMIAFHHNMQPNH